MPWHQDAAYLQPDADATLQMTAWIPFLDTNVRNGCMQVIRGGHRTGRLIPHLGCSGRTWYIEMDPSRMSALDLDPAQHTVTVPVPFGSVLLLNNLVPHRSLPNVSDDIRWSVDVRWQDSHLPSGFPAKPLLPLSRGDDPSFRPDWKLWAEQDRHVMVKPKGKAGPEEEQSDPFDTTIVRQCTQGRVGVSPRAAGSPSVFRRGVSAGGSVDESMAAGAPQPAHGEVGAPAEDGARAEERRGHGPELRSPRSTGSVATPSTAARAVHSLMRRRVAAAQ